MDLDLRMKDSLETVLEGPDTSVLRLGLMLPLSGPLGITGASSLNAASLAAHEVNRRGGVRGRPLELVLMDAGSNPARAAREARHLADGGLVEAFVGLHTSDTYRAVEAALDGGTPYIFTPPHEGGRRRRGVVLIGDSPIRQLAGAMSWLAEHRGLRRWALVGSDYIWAWAVHSAARPLLASVGSDVVLERFVPFGLVAREEQTGRIVEEVATARVDAVLLSLIGADQAAFNRVFGSTALAQRVVRVSGALEENGLLAAGGDTSGELYAAMRSFAGDGHPRHAALAQSLRTAFGDHAPVLDAYSESCYDGVHLAAALGWQGSLTASAAQTAAAALLSADGASDSWRASPLGRPVFRNGLARAEGTALVPVSNI